MNKSKPLPMTDAEILHSFEHAAVPAKQVKILAELNATTQPRIREILVKMGVDPRRLPRERKPKPKTVPDGLTAEVVTVDEMHTVDPTPVEDVKSPYGPNSARASSHAWRTCSTS